MLIFPLFSSGCEGGFNVEVKVFEQVNPPTSANSTLYVQKEIPKDISAIPTQLAIVKMWRKAENPSEQGSIEKNFTDEKGKCSFGFMNAPLGTYVIEVEKEHYQTVQDEFEITEKNDNPRYNHFINVLLIKELTP